VAGAPLLLPLAQFDSADLAAARLRQLVHELDLARVPLQRGDALRVLLEHANEVIARLVARPEDDEGLHDLPAVGVPLANDGVLRNGLVLEERALDLERADAVRGGEDLPDTVSGRRGSMIPRSASGYRRMAL
jgi:hypothetical protein